MKNKKMKTCIICGKTKKTRSVEHIVSESFGNTHYVMQKGDLCDTCNNRFSKFEEKALSNSIFVMERARLGVKTKKGKNAKGKVDELEIFGDTQFRKNVVNIKGIDNDNMPEFNPATNIGKLFVKSFDKSEVATSKMLLKTGIEALVTSRKDIYKKYNFTDLKEYLQSIDNKDWGFIVSRELIYSFKSIPRFTDKYNLKKIHCKLEFYEFDNDILLFRFTFGAISMIINLINRKMDWIEEYKNKDEFVKIYPEHINVKYEKKRK